MATLEEIARLASVSRSTVSRVVNDDPNVNAATRERVLAVVRELNFHPNVAARSLAAGRTRILGLVIPMGVNVLFADPYFPLFIQGVSAASNAHDHSVMLWIGEPEYERRTIRQILYNGLIEGVIVASHLLDDPVVEALTKSDLPFVLNGRHPNADNLSYVDVDNRNSAREMVEYLFRQGYERVATITGPKKMIAGLDRLEGYLAALRGRGITYDPELIVESDFTEAGGEAAAKRLLAFKPDAIFAASDSMAVGALRALRDANVRVPEDVAVAGFDDMPFAARTDPPLTTVRQPVQQSGYAAAETLIDLIERPDSRPHRIILPSELVIRESCGSRLAIGKRLT